MTPISEDSPLVRQWIIAIQNGATEVAKRLMKKMVAADEAKRAEFQPDWFPGRGPPY